MTAVLVLVGAAIVAIAISSGALRLWRSSETRPHCRAVSPGSLSNRRPQAIGVRLHRAPFRRTHRSEQP